MKNALPGEFGVSEFTTWPWTFEQDVQIYREMNVTAIEVCEAKLDIDPARARDQLACLTSQGPRITSVQPRLHSLFSDLPRPEPSRPAERMKRYRTTIDQFGRIAPGTTLVTITGAAPGGNYHDAFDIAVAEYRLLADYAADQGVRIALEPLNPILMNVDTFICSLADARRIVDAVDRPAFGLFVDVWHIFQDSAAVDQIHACGDRIFGVHINDWQTPRHFGDRAIPGKGVIPLRELIRAIKKSGYSGAYTLEIFSVESLPDSLWCSDLRHVISESRTYFEKVWSTLCD